MNDLLFTLVSAAAARAALCVVVPEAHKSVPTMLSDTVLS